MPPPHLILQTYILDSDLVLNIYRRLKPVFEYKITFEFVFVLWIHKGYFSIQKWCEFVFLKISSIQKYQSAQVTYFRHNYVQFDFGETFDNSSSWVNKR
jgi:hypothetical protein